jgi:hypothetical protein
LRHITGLKQRAVIDEAVVLSPIDFKAADREADHRSHNAIPDSKQRRSYPAGAKS